MPYQHTCYPHLLIGVCIMMVRDIATFFEQPLQYGGCISDFQNHSCNLISKKEVAAAILKIANTTSNLGLCCTSVLVQLSTTSFSDLLLHYGGCISDF